MQNSTKSRKSDMSGPAKTCPYGPIWAHKGPYGPIWAPTRTGPQPGLGPNPLPPLLLCPAVRTERSHMQVILPGSREARQYLQHPHQRPQMPMLLWVDPELTRTTVSPIDGWEHRGLHKGLHRGSLGNLEFFRIFKFSLSMF